MPTAPTLNKGIRMRLAKLGVAMPDGTYPVRNAGELQSAIDLAGKAGDQAPAVRKHIMRRAAALKLSNKIPDTWNSDGTLKHSDLQAFIAHHGVKGMHWGIRRRSPEEHAAHLDRKIAKAKASVNHHKTSIENIKSHIKDANENGTDAELFKSSHHNTPSATSFQILNGKTRQQALADHKRSLEDALSDAQSMRDATQSRLERLQAKRAKLQHDGNSDDLEEFLMHEDRLEMDEFLAHFGRKGMKWGQHVFGKTSAPRSADSEKAHGIRTQAKKSGIHTLSNEELQTAITRMDLENRFKGNISKEQGKGAIAQGQDFVKSATGVMQTGVNAYNTGNQAYKIIKPLVEQAASK